MARTIVPETILVLAASDDTALLQNVVHALRRGPSAQRRAPTRWSTTVLRCVETRPAAPRGGREKKTMRFAGSPARPAITHKGLARLRP